MQPKDLQRRRFPEKCEPYVSCKFMLLIDNYSLRIMPTSLCQYFNMSLSFLLSFTFRTFVSLFTYLLPTYYYTSVLMIFQSGLYYSGFYVSLE